MLSKRIIPCLDVKDGKVVKGIQFKNHKIIGDILVLSKRYINEGADELVFYDIQASINNTVVDKLWIKKVSEIINIPFCVAGGIHDIYQAKQILNFGADKISINSPALKDPFLISRLADKFGSQCVVIGIDAWYNKDLNKYEIKKYTGDIKYIQTTNWELEEWIYKVQNLGAGEIVLNFMNEDGECNGYNIECLKYIRNICKIPLIASGGAGKIVHFLELFKYSNVDGALAASVFHKKIINIKILKKFLSNNGITIR